MNQFNPILCFRYWQTRFQQILNQHIERATAVTDNFKKIEDGNVFGNNHFVISKTDITDMTTVEDLGQWQHEMLSVLDQLTVSFNKEAHVNKTFNFIRITIECFLGTKKFASNKL